MQKKKDEKNSRGWPLPKILKEKNIKKKKGG